MSDLVRQNRCLQLHRPKGITCAVTINDMITISTYEHDTQSDIQMKGEIWSLAEVITVRLLSWRIALAGTLIALLGRLCRSTGD